MCGSSKRRSSLLLLLWGVRGAGGGGVGSQGDGQWERGMESAKVRAAWGYVGHRWYTQTRY